MGRNTRSRAAHSQVWSSEELGSQSVRLCTDCGSRYAKGHGTECPACGSRQTVPGPKTLPERDPSAALVSNELQGLFTDRRILT